MRKFWKVARHEFLTTVTRRSFLLALILVPLVPALLLGLFNLLNRGNENNLMEIFAREVANPLPFGVYDQSGLIKDYPDWLTKGALIEMKDEATAREAVSSGRLQGFYKIDANYLESGRVVLIKPEISMFSGVAQSEGITDLINYNLMGSSQDLYLRYTNPIQFEASPINPETADTRAHLQYGEFLCHMHNDVFYFIIIFSSSMMLNSVAKEKKIG